MARFGTVPAMHVDQPVEIVVHSDGDAILLTPSAVIDDAHRFNPVDAEELAALLTRAVTP